MPLPAVLLIIATLLPLVAWVVLVGVGRRMDRPLAGAVGAAALIASFVCCFWALMGWVQTGSFRGLQYGMRIAPIALVASPSARHPRWSALFAGGIYIDSLSLALMVAVSLGTMLVNLFAIRSMRREPRFARFFGLLSFCCFCTLAMLLCGSLTWTILLMELIGIASAALIGFRWSRQETRRAALRMLAVDRVGDIAFIAGGAILLRYAVRLSWPEMWLSLGGAGAGARIILPDGHVMPGAALTAAGALLCIGAMVRCAQFPFELWAADTAEGVAPAAAMTLALTRGLAGVYLIARLFPILTPSARLFLAIVGVTTILMASLIATCMTGVKQVLAWVSVAQLGFAVLAFGVNSWIGATFQLFSYGFFQVLLFLSAGAVIRAARGQTGLMHYGGLSRRMPVTAAAAALGAFAAAGTGFSGIGLAGYYTHGLILLHAAAFGDMARATGRSAMYAGLFVVPCIASFFIAFALARWWMLTFVGRSRDQRLYDHAREVPALLWPLIILGILVALIGRWLNVNDLFEGSILEARESVRMITDHGAVHSREAARVFSASWPSDDKVLDDDDTADSSPQPVFSQPVADALDRGEARSIRWAGFSVWTGIAIGLAVYLPGPGISRRFTRIAPFSWLHAWLSHAMYFPELSESLFGVPGRGILQLLRRTFASLTKRPQRRTDV